ncbi:MAG TPA: hypothetical protein VLJ80_08305 [Solirubrobacteraceae bacterium]|nr:hypothetical protein [Solirubrobacteraceae bacterium]
MFSQLRSTGNRRAFLILAALGTLVFVVASGAVSYWIKNSHSSALLNATQDVLFSVFVALATGTITAGVLVFLYFSLFADTEAGLDTVACVDPKTTARLHKEDLRTTDTWFHDGHIGRWVRTEALPALSNRARDHGRPLSVVLALLDPNSEQLCDQYSEYRSLLHHSEPQLTTPEHFLLEILATITTAALYCQGPTLDVRIYFKQTLGFTRVDITDHHVFRTLVDPRAPCVVYSRHEGAPTQSFYDATRAGFENRLDALAPQSLTLPETRDMHSYEAIISFLELNNLRHRTDRDFADSLLRRMSSTYNPYR